MRILFANPPGNFARAGSRWPHKVDSGLGYVPFPFWLAYATSYLKSNGFDVDLKDCVALEWSQNQFKEYIEEYKPDLLVMETSAPSYKSDIETLKVIGNDKLPTVAVGYHATALPHLHLKDGFNYCVRGEFEFPLLKLAEYLDGSEKHLPETGIATRDNPNVLNGSVIKDLDLIPFPARDMLPMEKYVDVFAFGRSIQVITSRGCPFQCIFCCESLLPGKPGVRFRSAENVCDEIEELIAKYSPDEIYFDDSSFTVNREHVLGICSEVQKRKLYIPWSCMADAKVDGEMLKSMAEAGCRAIKFGVESVDPDVLANIPKHVNLEDVKRTVTECKKVGIKSHATFMFGLPGETREKAQKTTDFALSLGTDTAQFSIATPYPGTRFYEMAQKNNWLVSKDWEDFGSSAIIGYPDYSEKEILQMHRLAVVKWQRHIAFAKPATVWHYVRTAYRRGGILGVAATILEGIRQLLKGYEVDITDKEGNAR